MNHKEFSNWVDSMINSPDQKLVGDISTGYHWRNNGDILCDFCKKWGISYEINFSMHQETEIRFWYHDKEIKILVSEMDRNLDGVYRIIDKLKVVFDLERSIGVDYNHMFKKVKKENAMNRNDYIWDMDDKAMFALPARVAIKDVIFNDPATIVKWSDGTKTVIKCQDGDEYDPEKGLALAIAKKALGNKGNFNDTFKKWLPKEEEKELVFRHYTVKEYAEKIGIAPVTLRKHILKGKYPEAVKIADKWYIPVAEEM